MSTINDITSTADKIWAIMQRPSPAPTKDELMAILRDAYGAPTADESEQSPRQIWHDHLKEMASTLPDSMSIAPNPYWNNARVISAGVARDFIPAPEHWQEPPPKRVSYTIRPGVRNNALASTDVAIELAGQSFEWNIWKKNMYTTSPPAIPTMEWFEEETGEGPYTFKSCGMRRTKGE
jgi:hypothetical protein